MKKENKVQINVERTHYLTTYLVQGPKAEVIKWCKELKRTYHSAGYGTSYSCVGLLGWVPTTCFDKWTEMYEDLTDDDVVVYRAKRYNSCD